MPEPIYGTDSDSVTHYWYPDPSRKKTTKGWSGCGQKDHADFVSFSYTIDGDVTCIGCLATEGEGEMQGLLNDLTRSMEKMKAQGITVDAIKMGTITHEKMAQYYAQEDVDATLRILGLDEEP